MSKPRVSLPNTIDHTWIHYPGIASTYTPHGLTPMGRLDVFYEEQGRLDHIGYATQTWKIIEGYRARDRWLRIPIFNIWIYGHILPQYNLTSGDVYSGYPHLLKNPYRLIINQKAVNMGSIMTQIGKQIHAKEKPTPRYDFGAGKGEVLNRVRLGRKKDLGDSSDFRK